MPSARLYADYNATVPILPEALEAMRAAYDVVGNASSVHTEGRAAKRVLENARESLAQVLECGVQQLTLVSGATEGLHLALESANALGFGPAFVFAGEHDAAWAKAPLLFPEMHVIPANRDLLPDLEWLDGALEKVGARALVVMQAVNNETGTVLPLAALSNMVRTRGGAIVCDATQAFGKRSVATFAGLADWTILSSHKIGGPFGVGAIVTASGVSLVNHRPGGGQEGGARAGTHNTPAIAGFAAAARRVAHDDACAAYEARLARERDAFESAIAAQMALVAIAKGAPRVANTSCVAMPGWAAEQQVIALDLAGAAVSAGAACSSGKVKTSRALLAAGWDEGVAGSAIRASFGWATQSGDGARLAEFYLQAARRAGKINASGEVHV
jgi:cysteine desulfurase